jgi:predicted metal-dependent peptidase
MKFNKIIGKCDPKIVREAEDKLSAVFTELSLSYDNKSLGSLLGGSPIEFQLVYTLPHIADCLAIQADDIDKQIEANEKKLAAGETIAEEDKIPEELKKYRQSMGKRLLYTAATDGRRFYWNPEFVNKQTRIGLRLLIAHEAYHAIFLHPSRRGSRHPKLWNIAVDYRVNFSVFEDLRARDIKDYTKIFIDNMGEHIYLQEYADFLKDPFHPPPRLAHLNPMESLKEMADPAYVNPGKDKPAMYFGDHALSDDMKRPENVYDYLLGMIPKCLECGKLGKYPKPQEMKDLEKKIKENEKKKAAEEKEKQDKQDAEDIKNGKEPSSKKNKKKDKKDPGVSCNDPTHNHNKPKEKQKGKSDTPGDQEQGQEGGTGGQESGEDQDGEGESCCGGGEEGQEGSESAGQGQPGSSSPGQGDPNCCGGDEDGNEEGSCCGEGGCKTCGNGDESTYVDPFGIGSDLDSHIDTDVSEEELAKRIHDAVEMSKRMGGKTPGLLEDELGTLMAPKITWQDIVRQAIKKKRDGYGRNDWTRPKSRPLFAGLYNPKKRSVYLNILAAIDTSGSMSKEDIAYGLSQLQVIDDKGEVSIVSLDTTVYWDSMIKVKKADAESIKMTKIVGRGGTEFSSLFNEYEEKIKDHVDLILVITDGFLYDQELSNAKKPPKGTEIIWIVTSHNPNFKDPWGSRVLHLRND